MSKAELHILKQCMDQGRLNKARREALRFALPVGYVWDPDGAICLDPDEQVQEIVRLIFRKFEEFGTLGGLVRYLAQNNIQLGIRIHEGPGKGNLTWRRPNRMTIQGILKHPLYSGVYAYGRRQDDPRRKRSECRRSGRVVMARADWHVLVPDHAPAYISWDQYERNLARLQANQARATAMGASRAGAALLAGLVVCARCHCRLGVHYDGGRVDRYTYESLMQWNSYGGPRCQHLAGPCIDAFVSEQVVAALEPAALELSLAATERVEQDRADLERLWQQRRERAVYEVQRAARKYQAVEPENRLVARTLDRTWEEKLTAARGGHPGAVARADDHRGRSQGDHPPGGAARRRRCARAKRAGARADRMGGRRPHGRHGQPTGGPAQRFELLSPTLRTDSGVDGSGLGCVGHRDTARCRELSAAPRGDAHRPTDGPPSPASVGRDRAALGPDEWWPAELGQRLGIPKGSLLGWIRRGGVQARQLDEPLRRWVMWADASEQDRLRAYHQRSIGDEMRRRWRSKAGAPSTNTDQIGLARNGNGNEGR